MYCTYVHFLGDTGRVFYVGCGALTRPFQLEGRTNAWHAVADDGFVSMIVAAFDDKALALAHEDSLIRHLAPFGGLVNVKGARRGPRYVSAKRAAMLARCANLVDFSRQQK